MMYAVFYALPYSTAAVAAEGYQALRTPLSCWYVTRGKNRFLITCVPGYLAAYEYVQVCGILQVPTTQLAKMSFDLKFVELAADVLFPKV